MNKKIFCFYKDNAGIWQAASQEMFDSAIVEWKMFPFKQNNSWGFEGEHICYKKSDEMWRMFRSYLDYKKADKSDIVEVKINDVLTEIIFGSGLSCDELNKKSCQGVDKEDTKDIEDKGFCEGCPYWEGCPVQDRYRCPEGY